jgi:succinyl-diaminopimelate desuccinylase
MISEKALAVLGLERHSDGTVVNIPKDDPRVEALQQFYTEVTGRNDEPYTMGGGTYSRVMPNAVTFGPGVPGTKHEYPFLPEGHGGAHGRDEVVSMESIYTCSRIYAAAIAALDAIEA